MLEIKGARWYKADLHIHTAESKCFKDQSITPEQWVDRAIEQGLDCVAVTDHNTGDGIDAIKKASEGKGLTVFPGVEVTCSDSKVHIIVLFDLDKGTAHVNSFLSRLKLEPDKFGEQDAKIKYNVMDVIREAIEFGGLAIPAHIDQFNGLATVDYSTRQEIFESGYVGGVQAVHRSLYEDLSNEEEKEELLKMYGEGVVSNERAANWKKALQHAQASDMAILTFSDNPDEEGSSLHGLWGIGQRYTWIKMDKDISLEGLRQSLVLPDLRIINDFTNNGLPPEYPSSWINHARIINTTLNEQSEETIHFNPQMTTIIGGRGTGKSGILRFIRGIFHKTYELENYPDLLRDQNEFFTLQSNRRDGDINGVLQKDSKIEVKFNRYGIPHIIQLSNFDTNSCITTLKRWNNEGNEYESIDETEIESVLSLFKFEIYSQKQIYEIAKETNALREKIDWSINGMEDLYYHEERLRNEYLHQSSHIRTLLSEIEYKTKINAEVKDKERQLKRFEEGNFRVLFEENKKFNRERDSLSKIDESLEENKKAIESLKDNLSLVEIDTSIFTENIRSEVKGIISSVKSEFDVIHANIFDLTIQMEKLKLKTNERIKESEWFSAYSSNMEEYQKTKDEIGEEGVEQLKNLESLNQEIEKKKTQLERIATVEDQLEEERRQLDSIRTEYLSVRKQITEARKGFINEVIGQSDHIKMTVKDFRDRKNFEEQFRKVIQRGDTFNTEIESILDYCFHGNIEWKIPQFLQKVEKTRKGEEDDLITGRFANVIRSLSEEQLDKLYLIMPEDEIKVEYKDNNGRLNSLSNASAGQKTSAILTFLLSHGDTPLILDQPEDDLDNHLIYDLIVERIKSTKTKRQIIVVTHNANIPVNGDSELVIAMDSQYDGLKKLCSGSIENRDVKTTICKVMEGGEDAFKLRAKRYNIFE